MHRAGASLSRKLWRRIVGDRAVTSGTCQFPAVVADARSTHHLFQQAPGAGDPPAVCPDAVEALDREFGRDLGVARRQWRIGRTRHGQLETQSLRVFKPKPVIVASRRRAMGSKASDPEIERRQRRDTEGDPVDHLFELPARLSRRAGVLEEGQVETGRPFLITIEEVVDVGIVLVDRLGHQAKAENTEMA